MNPFAGKSIPEDARDVFSCGVRFTESSAKPLRMRVAVETVPSEAKPAELNQLVAKWSECSDG